MPAIQAVWLSEKTAGVEEDHGWAAPIGDTLPFPWYSLHKSTIPYFLKVSVHIDNRGEKGRRRWNQ
jgi:hypothetical protein